MTRLFLFLAIIGSALGQAPTGTIAGLVRDPSGAAIAHAPVRLVNLVTGGAREASTSLQGDYSFPALLPGEYEVSTEVQGFRRMDRQTSVEAGATTATDFQLMLGETNDSITVDASSPQIRYDSYTVGGLVTKNEIENLPLNGRSFLELAKLEPGVQPPTRGSQNRTFVPVLGAPGGISGRGTRITIDGGSIMAVGNGGSEMGFSQEAVQEFQISTVNLDLSTGITFSGAVNVVTRAGGNDLHGTAFYFLRDHKLAAYPLLSRDPVNPDPFFQRRQYGFALGGPVRRNRIFYFANWERNEQRGVVATTLFSPDFAQFSRTTPSPLFGDQISMRLDGRLSKVHTAFVRYSHDGSQAFGPSTATNAPAGVLPYPSNWTRQLAWEDQSILGLTSVFRPMLVNDLRFSYFFVSSSETAPREQDCPGCLGLGSPVLSVPQGGLFIGRSGTSFNLGRRYQLNDAVSWQRGTHRVRFGVDWEHNRGGVLSWANQPAIITLFSPDQVRAYNASAQTPANLRIPLPSASSTLNDILQLPLQSFTIGIGDPRVPQENGGTTRAWYTNRVYFQDTWRVNPRLTVNYGLAWNIDRYENYDLSKPALLAPLLGADGLGPTRKQWKDFSPALGLAWAPLKAGKMVIRAGAGVFYDIRVQSNLDSERAAFGPPGFGRQSIAGSSILNPLGGIQGVPVGTRLNFTGSPTLFTGANLMTILDSVRAGQQQKLAYAPNPSVRSIQITKTDTDGLFPANVPGWSALHTSAGLQREIARDFVLSADFVYRHFIHGGLGGAGVDLNHFNSVRGPVIPLCTAAQRDDPQALCSNGPINVWQAASNQTYKGLLIRADKRFSQHFQVLGSYAYSSNTGTAGTGVGTSTPGPGFNLDNWQKDPGPLTTDFTHILNLAGVVQLPRGFELGLNFSNSSAPPLSATVGGIDFNGDGTTGDLLPGTTVNVFNRGLGRTDLVRLVEEFNQRYAGTSDLHGRLIPHLTLPALLALGDNFHSLDLRLSRALVIRERLRLSLIGEVFNLYNKANLTGYSGDLTSAAFGQPTSRSTQLFGSGGPRAFQLAMRVRF